MDQNTSLNLVTEIGVFGSLDMKDPTATPVQELYDKTTDPNLRAYLEEHMKTGGNQQ